MPIYRIREYYSYYDEYEVDAEDEITAEELVDNFIGERVPVTGIEQLRDTAYDSHLDTMILDEDGNLLV